MAELGMTRQGAVAVLELRRGPHNFIDKTVVSEMADALESFDRDAEVRSVVLCSEGKNFCAGVDFGGPAALDNIEGDHIYNHALRLFRCDKPVVAAVQGSAVGAGLGLALAADFRVAAPKSRFVANFNRLGFHPGFGVSVTLPRAVGSQKAARMLYTGRRVTGEDALDWGLVDVLRPEEDVREAALELANDIAASAPLAVLATRRTLRSGLADSVAAAVAHEMAEQAQQVATEDFREGVRAMAERRAPVFTGR